KSGLVRPLFEFRTFRSVARQDHRKVQAARQQDLGRLEQRLIVLDGDHAADASHHQPPGGYPPRAALRTRGCVWRSKTRSIHSIVDHPQLLSSAPALLRVKVPELAAHCKYGIRKSIGKGAKQALPQG